MGRMFETLKEIFFTSFGTPEQNRFLDDGKKWLFSISISSYSF